MFIQYMLGEKTTLIEPNLKRKGKKKNACKKKNHKDKYQDNSMLKNKIKK